MRARSSPGGVARASAVPGGQRPGVPGARAAGGRARLARRGIDDRRARRRRPRRHRRHQLLQVADAAPRDGDRLRARADRRAVGRWQQPATARGRRADRGRLRRPPGDRGRRHLALAGARARERRVARARGGRRPFARRADQPERPDGSGRRRPRRRRGRDGDRPLQRRRYGRLPGPGRHLPRRERGRGRELHGELRLRAAGRGRPLRDLRPGRPGLRVHLPGRLARDRDRGATAAPGAAAAAGRAPARATAATASRRARAAPLQADLHAHDAGRAAAARAAWSRKPSASSVSLPACGGCLCRLIGLLLGGCGR